MGNSEGWETDDDVREKEENDNNNDFTEENIDVSENEVLYNKDGNVIGEEDIREELKEIMERHMSRLRQKLDMYTALAKLEKKNEKNKEEEVVDGKEEVTNELK